MREEKEDKGQRVRTGDLNVKGNVVSDVSFGLPLAVHLFEGGLPALVLDGVPTRQAPVVSKGVRILRPGEKEIPEKPTSRPRGPRQRALTWRI